jgi:hypothetical protein
MTRKDYILIADAIRATQERIRERLANEDGFPTMPAELRGVRRTAAHLADALAQDNPRFDAAIFLRNCGYGAREMLDENGDPYAASRKAWADREPVERAPRRPIGMGIEEEG